jgi:hypothetical protein
MTDAEKRKEERAAAAKIAAMKRLDATEDAFIADAREVWHLVPLSARTPIAYCTGQIRFRPEDASELRSTREIHFRPFRKFLNEKGAQDG